VALTDQTTYTKGGTSVPVNHELLNRVLAHITENKKLWDQGSWAHLNVNGYDAETLRSMVLENPTDPACGTAMCFAGHACNMNGWFPEFTPQYIRGGLGPDDISGGYTDTCVKDGERAEIDEKAQELLGLDDYSAGVLFGAGNDLDRLTHLVAVLRIDGTLNPEPDDEDDGDDICPTCGAHMGD
jgi:hypothetical protein